MVRHRVTLPRRCVKCNGDVGETPKRSRFYWHPPAWFVLVLLNVIIYAVVSLVVRRHVDVTFGLCSEHRRRRNRAILVGVAGVGLAIAVFAAGIIVAQPAMIPIALLVFLVALVYAVVKARALLPVRIDRFGAQFKGCGEEFLASLPSS